MPAISKRADPSCQSLSENRVLHGDAVTHLRSLAPQSVDLVCTDPPYGIGFMGHAWDSFTPQMVAKKYAANLKRIPRHERRTVPMGGRARDAGTYNHSANGNRAFQTFIAEIGTELLRVMKPGAFLFMTMAPRQDSLARAIAGLEDAGFKIGFTSLYWTFASGFPKAANISKAVERRAGAKVAVSKEAKALDGSYGGFQPKPAVEVVIVAMKPLSEKTYTDQALANGKGITWLDTVRIPYVGEIPNIGGRAKHGRGEGYGFRPQGKNALANGNGRFPANLLVSDGVLNDHSRFFSLDAWRAATLPFLVVPKPSAMEKDRGLAFLPQKGGAQPGRGGNIHPTVKPLTLMSYLIALGSRPGDLVLDPFLGSGTTAVAAKLLGRRYIGIEREQRYAEIAKARIGAALNG